MIRQEFRKKSLLHYRVGAYPVRDISRALVKRDPDPDEV